MIPLAGRVATVSVPVLPCPVSDHETPIAQTVLRPADAAPVR